MTLAKKDYNQHIKNDGLKRNWLIVQKNCQLTLLAQLKAHHEKQAKAKRDLVQHTYTQLDEDILTNKDALQQSKKKKLFKLLEMADEQLGETSTQYWYPSKGHLRRNSPFFRKP